MAKKWYPAGEVTPAGWFHLVTGDKPTMWLDAYDDSLGFHLLGGLAAPYHDPMEPEAVSVKDLKGLIPPWKHIQQKGATQDGITHLDALYDPTEIEMFVDCKGRDWRHTAQVVRDLIASIDAKQQSVLNFVTLDMGHWWAPVRWFQGAPPDPLRAVQRGQPLSLRLQGDNAFWRSDDHTASFGFAYESMTELFAVDHTGTQNLGAVPQRYTGTGGGYCTSNGKQMLWVDDPAHPTSTQSREVVNGPWPGFQSDTNNQVISQVHGGMQEWSVPESARNTLWGRMNRNPDGTWAGSGVRLYYGIGWIRLSYFINYVEVVVLRERPLPVPPLPGEQFTLVCGYEGDERMFKVLRGKPDGAQIEIMSVKETGTGSPLGSAYRGAGNGMFAAAAALTQATPSPIRKLAAGDNAHVTQQGWLEMVNVGDQPMYWDATLFGPFDKVKLYDGPGSDDYVEFGPLVANQIVELRTDPRSNTTLVQDLTVTPASPQALTIFQQAVKTLLSFISNQNAFTDQISSLFGIKTPQGNLYRFLKGRFSDNAAIPPKSPGNLAQPYHVKVEIVGGNADSKVIASGTPLRRYPL